MSTKNVAFFSVVTLALALMCLVVVTQFFTSKSTKVLITGNRTAVSTYRLNNRIQEIVNTAFDLERKLKLASSTTISKNRIPDIHDSLTNLGYNAYVLSAFSEQKALTNEIDSIVENQIVISEHVLDALRNDNNKQVQIYTDSLKAMEFGNEVYKSCLSLQHELRRSLQETLDMNSEQAGKLSLLNRVLAAFSFIAILFLATLIIRRQSQQLKMIDELKAAELAALKSKNAKDDFLANMSHELRTPLNALIGFGNLLNNTPLDSKQKEYVEIIKSSGYNLLYIVNDVLDLSKIEAGKLTIALRPFNLYDLFGRLKKMFSAGVAEKGLTYSCHIDEKTPQHVVGDPDRLQQIFINLISNAIKFTTHGGIEVSAGVIWVDDEEKFYKLSFTIKDSGIGIPKDKIGRIFERFEQLENGAQRQYGGTGLGLTIVKNLVERMGGSISVYSHVNEGSEFNFTCILEKSDTVEESISFSTAADYTFANYKVLVVEDNKANQILINHIFNKHHLSPRILSNGQEAVDVLKEESFDLVLMDIQMPVMDGYTAISILRNQLQIVTPVIAMTAFVSEKEVQKCIDTGFCDYIAKPIDEELLIQKMAHFLKPEEGYGLDLNTLNQSKMHSNDNLNFLRSIVGDDEKVIQEILAEMVSQWQTDKEDLITAANGNDYNGISRILHRIKSTFSSLGAQHSIYKIILDKERVLNQEEDEITETLNTFIKEVDVLIDKALLENANK